jgi:hypothetical protein
MRPKVSDPIGSGSTTQQIFTMMTAIVSGFLLLNFYRQHQLLKRRLLFSFLHLALRSEKSVLIRNDHFEIKLGYPKAWEA